MKDVIFRKLFYRVTEKDYGAYMPSIIVYEKRPLTCRTRVLSFDEAKEKGYGVEQIVEKYSYYLQLDLYFMIIRFQWER